MSKDIKSIWLQWQRMSMLLKLIVANAAVFVLLHLAVIIAFYGFGVDDVAQVLAMVELPSSLRGLLFRPWTLLTYMFAQYDVIQALFNMLWLYWFGIILQSVSQPRRVLLLYIYGGVAGALCYILAYAVLPVFHGMTSGLMGASSAVIAIVVATAIMLPNYKMNLMFLGAISLKWIAIITVGLTLIGANAGSMVAHAGGLAMGVVYALLLKRGIDLCGRGPGLWRRLTEMWHSKQPRRRAPKPNLATSDREELDRILDKIKKSGYTSLTAEERHRLFDVSSRIK